MSTSVKCGTRLSTYGDQFRIFFENEIRFEDGNIYIVIGPNGIGKSTLAKVLSNFIEYTRLSGDPPPDSFLLHPQEILLLPGSLEENISVFISKEEIERKLLELIDEPEVVNKIVSYFESLWPRQVSNLSGGEKQISLLLRTILVYAKESANTWSGIILDEPSKQLSPPLIRFLLKILTKIEIYDPLLLISHDFRFIELFMQEFFQKGKNIHFIEFYEDFPTAELNSQSNSKVERCVKYIGMINATSLHDNWNALLDRSDYLKDLFGCTNNDNKQSAFQIPNILEKEFSVVSARPTYGGIFRIELDDKDRSFFGYSTKPFPSKTTVLGSELVCIYEN